MKTTVEMIKTSEYKEFDIWDVWYIDWYTMNNWFDTAVLILEKNDFPVLSHIRDREFKIVKVW